MSELAKIAVLVKEVPDTYGERHLDLEAGLSDRGASEPVLDEICGRVLEVSIGAPGLKPRCSRRRPAASHR